MDRRSLVGVGLTSNQRLVGFSTTDPGDAWLLGKVDGMSRDTRLVGGDSRVQSCMLYSQGDNGGINTLTSAARQGFAARKAGGEQRFYELDLLTLRAAVIGSFPSGRQVSDVALPLDRR
ncbi:hypothetical protein [Streptomyces sp. NPDC003863]